MSDKDKNLNETLSQIEKQFGKGTVMKMGDSEIVDMPSVSTGSLGLDIALGIGGLPKGRVVEIFGPESSGKTTLTLQAIAECQKAGGTAAFIDAEHALDPNYAEKLGVNVDELLLSQPDTGEQALEVTDMLVKSGSVDLIVVDSVAALTPRAEIEGDMGDHHMGLQARLMSQDLRKKIPCKLLHILGFPFKYLLHFFLCIPFYENCDINAQIIGQISCEISHISCR